MTHPAGQASSSSSSSSSSTSPVVDLDATLPYPPADDDRSEAFEAECRRLLGLLSSSLSSSSSSRLSEGDAASLLSHLTTLHKEDGADEGGPSCSSPPSPSRWGAASVALVRATTRAAMKSLRGGGGGGGDPPGIMDGATARRLLADGVLPLASCSLPAPSASSSSSSSHRRPDGTPPPCVWIARLMRSIVVEDLLPAALHVDDDDCDDDCDDDDDDDDDDTTAVTILLSAFLTRMDSDESSGVLSSSSDDDGRGPPSSSGSVDDVLDRLCGVKATVGGRRSRMRPSFASAILASLREFGSSSGAPDVVAGVVGGGRMSRRRTREAPSRREGRYEYVDRHASLLRSGLRSLRSIVDGGRRHRRDRGGDNRRRDDRFDALPPLVYQLGLLPMGATSSSSSSSSSSSGGGGGREGERQRGMRLRMMCLEGIADALDNDDRHRRDGGGDDDDDGGRSKSSREWEEEEEAYRWARYTSLSHLGNCLRSDPDLCAAMLSLLAGETSPVDDDEDDDFDDRQRRRRPFRHARLTPFRLAMGLSMASSVPRMRTSALDAVRDLAVEEETLRARRGFRTAALDDVLFGGKGEGGIARRPWMDCLVRCLKMDVVEGKGGGGGGDIVGPEGDDGIPIVLRCLLSVAKFAESENAMTMGGGACGGGVGGGCASSLLQSLSQLGFLLIDCVKKDEPCCTASSSSSSIVSAMRATAVLAPHLDISSFGGGGSDGNDTSSSSAPHAVATIGRFLLCYLFYQSSLSSSRFSPSSVSFHGGRGDDIALCRSIMRTSFDKFCGMAPNASEHAMLLMDLLRFHPSSIGIDERNHLRGDDDDYGNIDDEQKGMIIALVLTTNHLPSIIDTLAGVSGGGMSPIVASRAIVPTLGRLLLLMSIASSSPYLRRRLVAGSLWKRHDLEDHVNQTFLLAKKCLFVPDVEKRKFAAKLLVMLLGVAAVAASSSSPSKNVVSFGSSGSSNSVWSSLLYDIKCCVRRCMTQHQNIKAIISVVSELLLSSLERYVTKPKEELTDRKARQQRAALGAGLSQPDVIIEDELPGGGCKTGGGKCSGAAEEKCNPFRFEKLINTRPQNSSDGGSNNKTGVKKKAKVTIGQTLLMEAMERINEPLAFLLASTIFDIKDNAQRAKEIATCKLATLILVSVTADVLIGTCSWKNERGDAADFDIVMGRDVANDIEDLFTLRADAISEATEIMSSFVMKQRKVAPALNKEGTKEKVMTKLKNIDANTSSQSIEETKVEKKKNGGKSSSSVAGRGEGMAVFTKVKSSEINETTLAKNRKLIEAVVDNTTPAMNYEFVAELLRKAGAERLGVSLLRGFEISGAEHVPGVLGLDHSDQSNDSNTCVSAVISVAMKLNFGLDGDTHLDLAQRFVSSLLFLVSKMISALAPSAEFLVVDGSFSSTLLKITKRMYGILVKLTLSFMANPKSLTSMETRNFLDYVIATLMPRVSALLFTLQEKQETAGGKFLAESKIESHGKTSALIVFEKERLDNALLKVAAKLKQSGLDEDSEWLENHVVSNLNRDFNIKRVEDAKAREAPKKKQKLSGGAKRKVKSEHSKSKPKKKRVELEEDSNIDDDSNDDSAVEVDADDSVDDDGEDVISLSKLTAEMGNDDGASDDGSDEELDSESEGEAEFDE
ncbi:hypothetical protein ACHAW5_004517 [Stephanodiscus triporus]|uniref:Uncharacterized protein n=1 Tax=Stephanodiscus triporus TaxID=2934178 RepID=A0ABD3QJI9_9STRA